ncbi:MAG: tetratricopeptide repeat protein [Pseudomonadota bacterium]
MQRFYRLATGSLFCFLLAFASATQADEIQDANKLFKQGQLPQALEKVDAVLASKPKDAQARFLKGLIVNEQGKTKEAIDIFTGLTNDYPELPEPYNNLAVLYAGQGQYEKAKIALEMAIRTHPSYATAHENLGDIYAKMASEAYDRALQLDKNNTGTQTKLALIRDLFGKGNRNNSKPAAPALANAAPATQPAPASTPTAAVAPVTATPAAPAPTATASAPAAAKPAAPVVVASTPAIAPVAAPAPVASKPAPDVRPELLQATHDWAAAWSTKNVKRYLSFYAPEFKTPGGESRATWEKVRRERISKPKSIQVKIEAVKVTLTDATHASVSFRQHYTAPHFKSANDKTLEWVKTGKGWQIVEERSND